MRTYKGRMKEKAIDKTINRLLPILKKGLKNRIEDPLDSDYENDDFYKEQKAREEEKLEKIERKHEI